ncbi:MAG: DUF5711 family protein [Cellulosilyticaceae bacterium]
MEQDTKEKEVSKTSHTKVISVVGILFGIIASLVILSKIAQFEQGPVTYKLGTIAFELPENRYEYIGVNDNQIIRVTKDGITAYDGAGQEIWTDTLSLDKVVVKQKAPYFAVGNMKDRKVSIFSNKGKEGDIVTETPIVYFSINKNGDVATIEETKEGHIISAYDKSGRQIPGKRVTHIDRAGFPIAVEVSPDRSLLLASYVDIYSPVVTTQLAGVLLDVKEEQATDNLKFGIEQKDNIIYEIEYLDNNTWVAIGDKGITYYNQEGKVVTQVDTMYLRHTPYVTSGLAKPYLPVLSSGVQSENALYGKQTLAFLDGSGKAVNTLTFDGSITYFAADDKGVVVGQGKEYKGFDREGELKFTAHAAADIEYLGYLGRKLVAITKNEVIQLEKVQEVKK